jgi:hypothetical protein
MKTEIWKDVKDYEGLYQISTFGRLKSFVVDKVDGRIMRSKMNKTGYLCYQLKDRRQVLAHRLVGMAFIPNPNNYSDIDHIDNSDKANNNVENLQWATRRYNVRKDQSDSILCRHETGREIIASGTRDAAKKTSCWRNSVVHALKYKIKTRTGWSYSVIKKSNS